MAKIPSKRVKPDPGSLTLPEPSSASEPKPEPAPRLSFALNENGTIDFASMRSRTKEKLKDLLAQPDARRELGIDGTSASEAPSVADLVPAPVVTMLYGAVGSVLVGLAHKWGYPQDEAIKMQFTPEEREALTMPTQAVLAKYGGSLGKWQEEIVLALAVGSVIGSKVSTLKKPAEVRPFRAAKKEEPETIDGGVES